MDRKSQPDPRGPRGLRGLRGLRSWRGWGAVERVLLCLTFGCFALMALLFVRLVAERLLTDWCSLRLKVLCVLIPCGGAAAVLVLLHRTPRMSGRRFAAVLFAVALVLRGAVAVLVDSVPISDFGEMYRAAVLLAQEGVPLSSNPYFIMWPYQSAFVAYMAALIRLFGADMLFFKLTNALYSALTGVLVYALARRFAPERCARAAALFYLLYPGTWLLIPVLTNQHLAELLFLAALYVYTVPAEGTARRAGLAAGAGALLALSNAIRAQGVVLLAAALCAMVLELLRDRERGWRGVRDALVRLAGLVAAYTLLFAGLSGLIRVTGINEYGLSNSCPEWKFVLGFNEETGGSYSREDERAVFGSEDPRAAASAIAKERMSMPLDRLLKLFDLKNRNLWGNYEDTQWMFTVNVTQRIDQAGLPFTALVLQCWIQRFSAGCYGVFFLLAALGGAAALWMGTGRTGAAQLLALCALAYYGALMLIEVQLRYRTIMISLAAPLTALGADALWTAAGHLRKRASSPDGHSFFSREKGIEKEL